MKDDLVDALVGHLEANETTYGKYPQFNDFYKRTGSPIKRERVTPPDGSNAVSVTKTRRRQTLARNIDLDSYVSLIYLICLLSFPRDARSRSQKERRAYANIAPRNSEEQTPVKQAQALVTRAPRTVSRVVSRVASQVDIPASPAQLANVADQSFQVARTKAGELWKKTYVDEAVEFVREHASTVTAVDLVVLLIEAFGLQWNTLSVEPAFTTPSVAGFASKQVSLPDYTKLLTSDFWAPATLWSLTSVFFPLLFSYFFNLTLRSNTRHKSTRGTYAVDPLTFSIVKALLQYVVYAPIAFPTPIAADSKAADIIYPAWGPFAGSTRLTVTQGVPGGYNGLQIGAAIGVLVAIYDAALKK